MSLILSIETSTALCSVALHREGELLDTIEIKEDGVHSRLLTIMIEDLLEKSGVALSDLSAIAISLGPGSYTGLRIGLATAKGMCFGLDLPLIGLSTLKILAQAKAKDVPSDVILIPMLDARRMEVYTAAYMSNLQEIVAPQAMVLAENSFEHLKENKVIVFGNGSNKWKESSKKINFEFDLSVPLPQAVFMGKLAFALFCQQDFQNIVTCEPDYLKEFMGTKPQQKPN